MPKYQGTLVIPWWVSELFWPLIFHDGINPAEFIKEIRELPELKGLFLEGHSGCNLFKGVIHQYVLVGNLQLGLHLSMVCFNLGPK